MSVLEALSGVVNLTQPLPGLVTAGQPDVTQLTAARDAGARVVIDLRDPREPRPFDEAATVRKFGMEYLNFPVTAGALSDELLDRILTAVRSHADTSVIVHCGSANRVGGALIPYFILDRGMAEQEAIDLATRIGLRNAEYMEWGLEYARRHTTEKGDGGKEKGER